jgi:hypothetical protein
LFDANGSTLDDGKNYYGYEDPRGRLSRINNEVVDGGYVEVNVLGQRIGKFLWLNETSFDFDIFHYDLRGRLISETTTGGSPKRELIYLGDIPVGVVQ